MTKPRLFSIVFKSTLSLIVFMLLQTTVSAQSAKVEGLIKGRDGDTMILQSSDSREVTVLLTENTEVSQKQGMLQVRRKEMAMAALIPGLAVQVEGTYDAQNRLLAKSVTFKGNDLERAQAIEAGMHESQMQTQQNKQELEKQNAELEKHSAELKFSKGCDRRGGRSFRAVG